MAATWTVNSITPAERVARILLGVLGTGVGVFLLIGTGGVLAMAVEVAPSPTPTWRSPAHPASARCTPSAATCRPLRKAGTHDHSLRR